MLGTNPPAKLSEYARPRAIIALVAYKGRLAEAAAFLPGGVVASHGEAPVVIARGWAARVRQSSCGKVQILNFLVPGDSLVRGGAGDRWTSGEVMALTPLQTVPVTSIAADGVVSASGLDAFCRSSAADEVNFVLDHAMRLGQQTALERTAHLLLELAARLTAVRLADNGAFALPINQECMSQALGMSAVHLNRTLQRLKADGLISVRGSRMAILRPDRLRRISAYGCEETSALHESPQQAWAS
ncbi:MAG: Crp/Fnr family transcriptional regulator [Caulobacterales bacterium]|nr:Crp/Fnr family transcriptional regulator [Caulobacterales bacterium]